MGQHWERSHFLLVDSEPKAAGRGDGRGGSGDDGDGQGGSGGDGDGGDDLFESSPHSSSPAVSRLFLQLFLLVTLCWFLWSEAG